jgi:hypothetical protein
MNNLDSDDMNSSSAMQTAAPNSFAVLLGAAVLLIGAALVFAFCRGPIGILCFIPAGLVVVAVASLIFSTVQVADQWNKAVVLRLGKFHALRGPLNIKNASLAYKEIHSAYGECNS